MNAWTALFVYALGIATGGAGVTLTIRADVEREAEADRTANGVARHNAHMDALRGVTRTEGADRGR